MTGSGTVADPYIVETLADLQAITDDPAAHYKLGADIDAADTANWHESKGFLPIGYKYCADVMDFPISVLSASGSWTGSPETTSSLFYKNVRFAEDIFKYIVSYIQAAATAEIVFGVTHPEDEVVPSPCDFWDATVEGYGVAIGGTAKYQAILRVNGTDYYGTERTVTSTTSLRRLYHYFETNPDTGLAWIRDDILGIGANPLEGIGIKVTSGTLKVVYIGWEPDYKTTPADDLDFSGTLDGDGHKISGLTICRPYQNVGLFLYVYEAEIRDVTLENVHIIGGDNAVGALAGRVVYGALTNCHSSGSVVAYDFPWRVGGLIGENMYCCMDKCSSSCDVNGNGADTGGFAGFIMDFSSRTAPLVIRCYATGQVDSLYLPETYQQAGGFVGNTQDAIIEKSFALGDVFSRGAPGTSGRLSVGGFGGDHEGDKPESRNCFARGSVSYENIDTPGQGEWIGGFIGRAGWTATVIIENCYATGLVSGISKHGFCGGSEYGTAQILDCFWDTETSGCANSHGGTGKTTAQMKTQPTFTNWDFDTIWAIFATYNDGYPLLILALPVLGILPAVASSTNGGTIRAQVIDAGIGTIEYRFRWRKGIGAYSYSDWANSKTTGDILSQVLTGLAIESKYEYAAQGRNLSEGEWSNSGYFLTLSNRKTQDVEDEISLKLVRNIEMAAQGRLYTDAEGNAVYKSRYGRNT